MRVNPFRLPAPRRAARRNIDPVLTYWFTIVPLLGLAGAGTAYGLHKFLFDKLDYTVIPFFEPQEYGAEFVAKNWDTLSPQQRGEARKWLGVRALARAVIGGVGQTEAWKRPGHMLQLFSSAVNGGLWYQTFRELDAMI